MKEQLKKHELISVKEKACSDLKSSFSYLHRHQGKRSDHHNKQSLNYLTNKHSTYTFEGNV